MRLLVSKPSPYARKAWAAVLELGLGDRVAIDELPARLATTPKPDLEAVNPLAKVPTLLRDDGPPIIESGVIVAYLDSLAGGRLVPGGDARWLALTLEALADGLCDAGVVIRLDALRPEQKRDPAEAAAQAAKIERTLDSLDRAPPGGPFQVGQLALACALDWIAFRALVPSPLAARPRLAAWRAAVDRPSLAATAP